MFKRKITSAKIGKICWQIAIAALMQPLHYDLRYPAAKDNRITHAAMAPSNLDAAMAMRAAETEVQNTIERRAKVQKMQLQNWISTPKQKNDDPPAPKLTKFAVKSSSRPWCSHSITIYDIRLQKTIVLHTQPWRQATLTQPSATREPTNEKNPAHMNITTHCRIRGGTDSTLKRPQPHLSHTGDSFHRRPKPLYTDSCSGFPMQHSCSHYTAICNQRVNKRIESRTNVEEESIRPWNDRSRTRRTQEVASIAGRSHFTRKKHKVSCSGIPPNTSPSQPSWSPLSQHPSSWV